MRDYRIEAEVRQSPDLHRLAQLFIGMARSRAEQDRATPVMDADTVPPLSEQCRDGEVESEALDANG